MLAGAADEVTQQLHEARGSRDRQSLSSVHRSVTPPGDSADLPGLVLLQDERCPPDTSVTLALKHPGGPQAYRPPGSPTKK